MITITDRVKTWITEHPFHATFMADGLINASALARLIQPDIASQMGETVTVEAVTLALNRHGKDSHSANLVDFDRYIGEVSVQSGLSIMTIPQVDLDSGEFFQAITELQRQQEYTIYTRGIWHTALIGKKEIISTLSQNFPGTITSHDIVGITVKLKPGHLPVPGVCAYVLQKLAYRNINLQEVTSSHNELTVFINRIDTNRALECLV